MRELIRKSVLLGLGAASLTKEKIDELIAEFVKIKAITTKDGRLLARQILEELGKNKKRLEKLSKIQAEILRRKASKMEKVLMKKGVKTAKRLLKAGKR